MVKGGARVSCRKMIPCEINNVLADSNKALVSVVSCCKAISREMCAYAVKINGSYRITLEGRVCDEMLNALGNGESIAVKYTGKTCSARYCVIAVGEPDSVTACGCNKVKIVLTDFVTDGTLR